MNITKEKLLAMNYIKAMAKFNIKPKKMVKLLSELELEVCDDCGTIMAADMVATFPSGQTVCENCYDNVKVISIGAGKKIHADAHNLKSILDENGIEYKTYAFNQSYFWTNTEGKLIFGSPFQYTNYNNCGHEAITVEEMAEAIQRVA